MDEPGEPHPRVVVIVGGDRDAVSAVAKSLPQKSGMAFVFVAPSLDGANELRSALPIEEIKDGTRPDGDRVYVVPADHEVVLRDGTFGFAEPTNNHRAPADKLMRSIADHDGRDVTGVILSGSSMDGAFGIKRIKEVGGVTLAQDPGEANQAAAPAAAIATGHVDAVLPLDQLVPELVRLAAQLPTTGEEEPPRQRDSDTLRDILVALRVRTGHDFSQYKRQTLLRRISRRMHVCATPTLVEYHRHLREHPNELQNLLRDLLISVTTFFRDQESYDELERVVIPKMFANKTSGDSVRAWVAGCATGEEAYSIAMLLAEHASKLPEPPQLQVFATDIDELALAEARAGFYRESVALDVPRERLDKFFEVEAGGYRVRKELRALVLFSPHNLLRDPPFSRLDLITCRNLLIYLSREAQDRVLTMFHFALKPDGFLFLGASESAESKLMQFSPIDTHSRIFSRAIAPSMHISEAMFTGRWWPPAPPAPPRERVTSFGELHHRLVEQYAPPSVLVNEELEIVHLSEHAGRFLTLAGGEPSRHLLTLIHPALRLDLRTAVYTARHSGQRSASRIVRFEENGQPRAIEIRARVADHAGAAPGMMLILFDELEPSDRGPAPILLPTARAMEPIVRDLEEELQRTREQLRATVEQYETSLEELKASNEELQAINEELRAATEELETSKEELQSVNEELTAVNSELKIKIEQLARANSDVQNLMTATDIGALFLDRDLSIKLFTPRARDLFNVIPSDIGRPLGHITHRLDFPGLVESAADVLQNLRPVERQVGADNGRRYLVRILPYRATDDRIDGVVLTFFDVTDLAALQRSEQRFRVALRTAPIIATSQNTDLQYTWAYVFGRELGPGVRPPELENNGGVLEELRQDVLATRTGRRIELELAVNGGGRVFDVRVDPLIVDDTLEGVTTVAFDITSAKRIEAALRESDRRKDEFLATLSHELRNPLTPLRVALDLQRAKGAVDAKVLASTQDTIDRQITQLTQLVDELLDLARITQGKIRLDLTRVAARDALHAAVEATKPVLDEAGVELGVAMSDGIVLRADPTRLVQVLTNLLRNAARFTPKGGHVKVDVKPERERGVATFSVRDDGIGIPPAMLPQVFELFAQSRDDNGRARSAGLGIGLSLVRRLVELHGGNVRAYSEGEGKGSEFVVEIPLDRPDER